MTRNMRGRKWLETSTPLAFATLKHEPHFSRDERRFVNSTPFSRRTSSSKPTRSHITSNRNREITVNERNESSALSAELERTFNLTALLSHCAVETPAPTEIDELTRAARKALVEARNLRTKDRAHPVLVVAVFDQVSHALSRFASPDVDSATIVRDAATTAAHAARGSHLAPEVLAQGIEALFYDAASVLANVASVHAHNDRAKNAAIWLLRRTMALVKNAPSAALAAAGLQSNTQDTQPTLSNKASAPSKRDPTEKEVAMKPQTEKNPLLEKIQIDATDAAWRTAGSQFVKLTREPLVGLLTRHLAPGDDAFRARAALFLETELGGAIVASILSAALSALPVTAGEVPQKLARELRVRAMSETGDVLADLLMGPLRQVIALYLQDPAAMPEVAPMAALPQGAAAGISSTETLRERVGVER